MCEKNCYDFLNLTYVNTKYKIMSIAWMITNKRISHLGPGEGFQGIVPSMIWTRGCF